ncbi:uncharacterized protein LOC117295757 [Asterias rubens]|uniref:uncharacterized protein LOC117295757 n=1 Tax=Asterias rubens TaxID=7604 RepID=UPI0014554C75|nr:uncharacterized protein LOC117295757 [Asterias rubens]
MSSKDRNFKVALLVDARRRIAPTEKPLDVTKFAQGVRLCVLKLLSYFAHCRDDGEQAIQNLRWGLKMFHSYDYPPCKRDYLKELNIKNFQDFEEQLAGDLDALSSSIRGKRAPKTPQVLTATSVRQALDDVIHDFQWDGPDVSSPVKMVSPTNSRTRRKPSHHHGPNANKQFHKSCTNFSKCVFLFMPCPVSRSELEEFCDFGPDDLLPSKSEFLEMVVPSGRSYRTFQDQNIALFWIDSSPWMSANLKRDQDGLSVISAALQDLGGCIIPVHAIINQSQDLATSLHSVLPSSSQNLTRTSKINTPPEKILPANDYLSSTSKKMGSRKKQEDKTDEESTRKERDKGEKITSCSFLPFSSIMDHYVKPVEPISFTRQPITRLRLCANKDGQVTDLCQLELHPLTRRSSMTSTPSKPTKSSPTRTSSTQLSISTPKWSQSFHIDDSTKASTSRDCQNTSKSTQEDRVTIRAQLALGAVPISQYQPTAVYTCTGLAVSPSIVEVNGTVEGEVEGQSVVRLSSWFKDAMVGLSQRRKVLLVDMPHPETCFPVSAVLEPLTSTTASLRILKALSVPRQVYSSNLEDDDHEGQRNEAENDVMKMTEITKECIKKHRSVKCKKHPKGSKDRLNTVSPSHVPCETVSFRPHLLEPWFSYSASGGASTRLIDKLLSIPHYDNLSEPTRSTSVNQLLQSLEEVYSGKPGTISNQNAAMKSTGQAEVETEKQAKQPTVDACPARQSPRLKRKKSSINVGFRTEKIMSNSIRIQTTKEPSPQKKGEKENRVPGREKTKTSNFECPKLNSEEDVIDCLQTNYERTLNEASCGMHFVQFMTSIVLSYLKSEHSNSTESDAVMKARDILTKTLLVSSKQLREKYQSLIDEPSKLLRVQETELQVLLRLEMEAISPTEVTPGKQTIPGTDDDGAGKEVEGRDGVNSDEDEGPMLPENVQASVDEIVRFLRTVPFLADHNRLTSFLSETLVQNYADSLPHILRAIYDDLMQPLPSILLSPSNETSISSVQTLPPPSYKSSSSHGSFAEPSVSSIRTRSVVRHPSLADMGTKRVIPIPSRNAAKKKVEQKEQPKQKVAVVKDDEASNAKTVRRNLFMGGAKQSPKKGSSKLPRRQSVAVMQNIHNTRKSPRRHTPRKSDAPFVLKTRVVKETPGKKQVLQAMLKKQERARKISTSGGEKVVPPTPSSRIVQESPLKTMQASNTRRSSPRIKPKNPGHRRSFYSLSSSTDLKRARELASRIAGKTSPTPSLNKSMKIASRKSFLSEIVSPGTLKGIMGRPIGFESPSKNMPPGDSLESPSRNTRSQVDLAPPTESLTKTDVGNKEEQLGKGKGMFKTPVRTPRRINFNSPAKSTSSLPKQTTGSSSADGVPLKNEAQVLNLAEDKSVVPLNSSPSDKSKTANDVGASSMSKVTSKSSEKRTEQCFSKSANGKQQLLQTKKSPVTAKLELNVEAKDSLLVTPEKPPQVETDFLTPSRRSLRLLKSPDQTLVQFAHPESGSDNPKIKASQGDKGLPTQNNFLKIPTSRKRKETDRSPSPNSRVIVHTPSPRKQTKSITPSSLHKWQRRKKPRYESPERSTLSIIEKITPPSIKRTQSTTTLSPSQSPKFGKVTPPSKRKAKALSSAKKLKSETPEDQKRKCTKQTKLGTVCKANVNLLTLITDLDPQDTGKMQTRSRSREEDSTPAKKDTQSVPQEVESFTFLDTHLDDSDDDVDFPNLISPVRKSATKKTPEETSDSGNPPAGSHRLSKLSVRSSTSVFEEESFASADEVFLQDSPPSGSKKLRVTTPLTTVGLFTLMNSPMVSSAKDKVPLRSKVSFDQPTRKGGRQLYTTGSQSSSESFNHNMVKRSSSLDMRRLSDNSPVGKADKTGE